MRRLIHISYLLNVGADVSAFNAIEVENAKRMYDYVYKHSGQFTGSFKYLEAIWQAAYFKIVGYKNWVD